jgi:hypothetical protein
MLEDAAGPVRTAGTAALEIRFRELWVPSLVVLSASHDGGLRTKCRELTLHCAVNQISNSWFTNPIILYQHIRNENRQEHSLLPFRCSARGARASSSRSGPDSIGSSMHSICSSFHAACESLIVDSYTDTGAIPCRRDESTRVYIDLQYKDAVLHRVCYLDVKQQHDETISML